MVSFVKALLKIFLIFLVNALKIEVVKRNQFITFAEI